MIDLPARDTSDTSARANLYLLPSLSLGPNIPAFTPLPAPAQTGPQRGRAQPAPALVPLGRAPPLGPAVEIFLWGWRL